MLIEERTHSSSPFLYPGRRAREHRSPGSDRVRAGGEAGLHRGGILSERAARLPLRPPHARTQLDPLQQAGKLRQDALRG